MIVASPLILAVVVVLLPGAVVIVGLMTLLGVLEGDKE